MCLARLHGLGFTLPLVLSILLLAAPAARAQDTVTLTPSIDDPLPGGSLSQVFTLAFTLPEAAGPGTVHLAFQPAGGAPDVAHTLNFSSVVEGAGSHVFLVDGTDLTAAPEVASVTGPNQLLSNAVYNLTLAYQDALLNPPAQVSVVSIYYDPQPVPAQTSTWGAIKALYR